jgi:alkanesulfonate monooxygenase SsuD/methylene tetrahydromethanopterin reductase-like flavin-dependent oxidoreductase (luciferase family)
MEVSLQWVPAERVPVFIGGSGPKTPRLAGELADGIILDCQNTVESVRDALAHVAAGRHGRDPTPFTTVVYLACAPGPDAETKLSAEGRKWNVASPKDFGVGRSAEQIRARADADAYRAAGVDTLLFQPVGADTALVSVVDAVARL